VSRFGGLARRPRMRLRPRPDSDRMEAPEPRPSSDADGPMMTALLVDGPLAGDSVDIAVVEGRPPKTVDVPTREGAACRYCLDELEQRGASATYTFVYRV
jgi:hypothetical protein